MSKVFADTFFYLALLSDTGKHNEQANALARMHDKQILTSAWVLVELANGLSRSRYRQSCVNLIEDLLVSHASSVIPPNLPDLNRGLALYSARQDKRWSLTDCISFVIMEREGITQALTADRHFAQAGFEVLFPEQV